MSVSRLPLATSRDPDGNATKKSAQECESPTSLSLSTDETSHDDTTLAAAFENARAKIKGSRSGQTLFAYKRDEINQLFSVIDECRVNNEDFIVASSITLAGFGDQAKGKFQYLCGESLIYHDMDTDKMWERARNCTPGKRQEAVHGLMNWAREDNLKSFEIWMTGCLPTKAIDVFQHGDRGLASIAHSYLKDVVKLRANERPRKFYLFDRVLCLWNLVDDGAVKNEVSIALEMVLGKIIDNVAVEHAKRTDIGQDEDALEDVFDANLKFLSGSIARIRNAGGLSGIITFMASMCVDTKFESNLDSKPDLLGVQNGVVDLRTGELRHRTPEDAIFRLANSKYDPSIDSKWFNDIVMSMMADDQEMVAFLQRFLGYCITGERQEEVFTFFTSSGRNGKGLLMRSLSVLMGQFYAEMDTANILEKTATKMDLAKGSGCRIWSFNETPQNAKLKSDVIQMLSGGDGIPVKVAHRQSQTLTPHQKCIVTTNHLPELGIVTEALRSRLMIIRFPVVFKDLEIAEPESQFVRRIDPGLKRRIEENLPTFLKWVVEGSMDWYSKKFEGRLKNTAPSAVKEATEDYLQRFDTFAAFLDAKCVLGAKLKATTKELLVAYKDFFGEDIEGRSFAKLMTSYSPAKNIGRAKLNGYKGLSLK